MNIKTIITAIACLSATLTATAQYAGTAPVPQDPELRTGTLSNGMTYYIRHSHTLPGHADFHIFHSVGAIQEEDNQNGLAHFLEHVAFKGLTHLPGNELLDYMERNGVKFGPNLNASTSFDYTRYMLRQVPVTRPGMIDTCLLVLADWSGSILATQEAIDFERGVIREEYRSRGNLENRINIAMQPFYFQGSKYAQRTVIGDMDIVAHFSRTELLDFYHTWYRPDQQAIVIVGDIDAAVLEKTVRERFSALPEPAQPKPKTAYPLPGNTEPIYAVYRDAEVAEPSISLLFKHPQPADADRPKAAVYTKQYVDQALIRMMNFRWQDLSEQNSNPLKQLDFSYGEFMSDQDVFAVSATFKADKAQWIAGLDQLLQESQRFRQLGFQEAELKRVKADLYKQLERQKLEAGKPSTDALVDACLENFLHREPIPSAETRYQLLKHTLDTLSLAYANQRVQQFFGKDNQIVGVVTSKADSSAMPGKSQILAGLKNMDQVQVNPYHLADAPMLQPAHPPKKGKVVKETPSVFGTTEWTLSNGAHVLILPTTNKKDEVLLMASNPGGRSVIPDADLPSSYMLISQLMNAGVGTLDATALKQALSGHIVYATPYLSEFDEGISCSASPSDLETLFKLMYMYFTEARFDAGVLHRDLQQYAESMGGRKLNPMAALQDSVMLARSSHHPRSLVYLKDTTAVKLERIKNLYREHFGNPADFKWIITGSTDLKTLKPLVEKYIGGFPNQHREDHWADLGKRSPLGEHVVDFTHPMETPKSITFMEYTEASPFSLQKLAALRLLKDVLDIRFKVLLRDDKSGVYTTDGEGSFAELPIDKMQLIVSFQSDPARMDELSQIVFDELRRLAKEGIAAEDLQKSKEYLKKAQQSETESNYYWQSMLYAYTSGGRDKHSGMEAAIDAVSAEDIRQLLAGLLAKDNLVHVTMRPEIPEKGTHFETGLSWQQVQEKARKEHKYLFVDCYTTWCGPCKQMATEVFPQEKMGQFFNPRFVSVSVQMDRTPHDSDSVKTWYGDADSIAKRYQGHSYPTFLIFSPEGELVHRLVAGGDPDSFIAKVKLGLDTATQYYPMLRKYQAGDRSLPLIRNLARASRNIYDQPMVDRLLAEYFKLRNGEPGKDDLLFAMAFSTQAGSPGFKLIAQYQALADDLLGPGTANDFLAGQVMASEVYVHYKTGLDAPLGPLLRAARRKYPGVPLDKPVLRFRIKQYQYRKDEANYAAAVREFNQKYPGETL